LKLKGQKLEISKHAREAKAADELATMILNDLRQMADCPQDGVTVIVYGILWRAMLSFGVAAGPVHNKAELQEFFETVTERLQRLYDVA
jgi:hypothetical protein